MLIRLTSKHLPDYADIIDLVLNESLPNGELETRNLIYQDLLLDFADCWVSYQIIEGVTTLKAMAITKITDNIAVGSRTITVIATYGFDKLHEADFIEAFETVKKFAQAHNCHKMDFYSTNDRILQYARMFTVVRECTYLQLSFDQSMNKAEV